MYRLAPASAFNENLGILTNCDYALYTPLTNVQHACNAEGVGHSHVGKEQVG